LIEVWSGERLDRFLQKSIFEPLEMTDTGFWVPKGKRLRFTTCYTPRSGKLAVEDQGASSPFNDDFEFLSGGGGLVSTMRDYANFCQMLVDGGQFKGHRLLKEATLKLMFTDQLNGVSAPIKFGLGFDVSEVQLGNGPSPRKVTQYGWGGYASTLFRIVPEERFFQIFGAQQVPTSQDSGLKQFSIIYEGSVSHLTNSGNQ
jgi:CubicO group peptidase (beta-lactamase class C family)